MFKIKFEQNFYSFDFKLDIEKKQILNLICTLTKIPIFKCEKGVIKNTKLLFVISML